MPRKFGDPIFAGDQLSAETGRRFVQPKEREVVFEKPFFTVGCSVQGASHEQKGLPNQDALKIQEPKEAGEPTLIALSDGVSNCPRSEKGSILAVKAAIREVSEFFKTTGGKDQKVLQREVREILVPGIIQEWRGAVEVQLKKEAFGERDIDRLRVLGKKNDAEYYRGHPGQMYGATLVVVASTVENTIFIQVGDGDALILRNNGDVWQPFFDKNEIGDDTYTMGTHEAEKLVKVSVVPTEGIKSLLVTTDGFPKSFATNQAYMRTARDYLQTFDKNGEVVMRQNLPQWLMETSHGGSGDDITVAMMNRQKSKNSVRKKCGV